jgi:hypothetical protein
MDERILTILKEVAQERTLDNDGMNLECVFCSGDCDYTVDRIDDIAHQADCPTILARTVLRESGTPLQAYCVEYDYGDFPGFPEKKRLHAKQYITNYNGDEIKKSFPQGDQYSRYNVEIIYVKDL